MRSLPIALILLPAAALALAGCSKHGPPPAQSPALPAAQVRLQTVETGARMETEEVAGTVRAKVHATLEAKLSGRIVALPVALGEKVKAGQLLARLDAAEIKARYDQAVASFDQAEREWKRTSGLFAQQGATQAEYDAARARQRVAKAAVAEARAMMSYVEIEAPFDGVVTRKWADLGDLAVPGKPLLDVQDPSALQLEADVPEAIAGGIQPGARLGVRVDSIAGPLTGSVAEIAPASDPATRTFQVKLDLPLVPGLMPGQFARLQVPIGESISLRVPASAVVRRGQLDMVFVDFHQRARMRLVKTGEVLDGGQIEILSGLDPGDSVVTEGAPLLTDGQPLESK